MRYRAVRAQLLMADPVPPVEPPNGNVVDIRAARARQDTETWKKNLMVDGQGNAALTTENVRVILQNDPLFDGMFGYCEFTSRHVLLRAPPFMDTFGTYPREWETADAVAIQGLLAREWFVGVKKEHVVDTLDLACKQRRFHPVRDYFCSLGWDGTPRVDTWLCTAFGAPELPHIFAYGRKWLMAAVRRIFDPGTKFDHTLVLIGVQDLGKSRALMMLCPDPAWFLDNVGFPLASPDAMRVLESKLIVEFSEIETLFNRQESGIVKSYLTRQVDHYRDSYGRRFKHAARQCVFAGTTNHPDFLTDPTGNRRLWSVECAKSDLAWVEANRDQLWAEAMILESTPGATLFLSSREDVSAARGAAAEQRSHIKQSVWHEAVMDYVDGLGERSSRGRLAEVTVAEILEKAIGKTPDKFNLASDGKEVGNILRGEGWIRKIEGRRGNAEKAITARGSAYWARAEIEPPIAEDYE